jgi:hypothetical protein
VCVAMLVLSVGVRVCGVCLSVRGCVRAVVGVCFVE